MKKYCAAELELIEVGFDVILTSSQEGGNTPTVDVETGDSGGGTTPWDPVSIELGNDSGISGGAN